MCSSDLGHLCSAGDLPPLILSPSQYHNYTQPRGNFIPYANEDRAQYRSVGNIRSVFRMTKTSSLCFLKTTGSSCGTNIHFGKLMFLNCPG